MKLSKVFSAWIIVVGVFSAQAQVKIDFDFKKRGQLVTEDHYGIFFEEINHAVRTGADINTTYVGYNSETAEQFSRPFDLWQELSALPAGSYQLFADAFYRAGAIEPAYDAWQKHDISTDYAQLYLGDVSVSLHNLYSCDDYSYSPYRYPDNLAAASKAFNNNDRYRNSVIYTLPSDKKTMRLGIRKLQTVDADWVAYDHFQLRYLGDGTGVSAIPSTLNHEPSAVYDLAGRRLPGVSVQDLHNLPAGIYIIGGKKYISHQ